MQLGDKTGSYFVHGPKTASSVLLGHEVIDIRGTQKEGADDAVIFNLAQEQQAVFLTTRLLSHNPSLV